MISLKFTTALLGVSIIMLSFSNCGNSKTQVETYTFEQYPPFTIGEVYSQEWVAGVRGGGSGTNLHITFNKLIEDILIKDIYFQKQIVKSQRSTKYKYQYIGYFKSEMNRDIIMDINPINEAQNTPLKYFPFKLEDNEAVISYLYKEEIHYFMIVKIKRKPMLNYPTTKTKKNDE